MKYTQQTAFEHGDAGRTGVLITNLGTPDSCEPVAVRRYLKEFLWDRRVIEMSRPLWWLVLHLIILNVRPRKSARAYRKVWGEDGSPLLAICRRQQRKLEEYLGAVSDLDSDLASTSNANKLVIELGMRYGNPSIPDALAKLKSAGVRRLLVLPLYPQYCAATTASTFDAVTAELARWRWLPALRMVDHYHDNPDYIRALADSVRDYRQARALESNGSDDDDEDAFLLMSFHGIPQAYFQAGDPYHCECVKTARLLAEELGLTDDQWWWSFQSRFGPKKWLQPYTDRTLADLARAGTRNVQVICPGFSADCLETLEEIAMQNREVFIRAGGESFNYIPCLNDRDQHIRALAGIITDNLDGWTERDNTDTDRRRQKERAMEMGAKA